MRPFISATVLALSLAVVPVAAQARPSEPAGASAPTRVQVVRGLLLTPNSWGPLKLGMTSRQAQRTGMVTTKEDHCAPGYQMATRFQGRGFVFWSGQFPKMTVGKLIISGTREHTARHIHVGSTLRQLRAAYPRLSRVYRSGVVTGQYQTGDDLFFAYVHKPGVGTLNFQFAYGSRPRAGSKIAMIVVSPRRAVYFGC